MQVQNLFVLTVGAMLLFASCAENNNPKDEVKVELNSSATNSEKKNAAQANTSTTIPEDVAPTTATPSTTGQRNNSTATTGEVVLKTFSKMPPQIDGCACYFSTTKDGWRNKQYIYVDNYDDKAFANVDGAVMLFALKNSEEIAEGHYRKTFYQGDYQLIIEMKKVGQLDETFQQEGTFQISKGNGPITTKRVYGECGC